MLVRGDYVKGRKFRVIRPGAHIEGSRPRAPFCHDSYRLELPVGTILTCFGVHWTAGDGVPAIMWRDEQGQWICNEAVFWPAQGGMWDGYVPEDGYLAALDDPVSG